MRSVGSSAFGGHRVTTERGYSCPSPCLPCETKEETTLGVEIHAGDLNRRGCEVGGLGRVSGLMGEDIRHSQVSNIRELCIEGGPQPCQKNSVMQPPQDSLHLGVLYTEGIKNQMHEGGPSRWQRSKTWSSPSSPQIHLHVEQLLQNTY